MDLNSSGIWVLVPIFGMIFVFGFPMAAWVVFRLLAHRERLEMIRNGVAPPPGLRGGKGYRMADPGFASNASCATSGDPRYLLRKGISLAFIGFALTIGLSFIGFNDGGWRPGPWLLGGLIPLFIGLAQVTTAFLTDPELFAMVLGRRAAFGPTSPNRPFGDMPSGPQTAAPPQYDTSYTYRPGGTQELRPPTPPPERRSS